ncbi:MAG: DtxR family transcriptional regulator [Pseudonocardiales bacterium]|nr:MAG: DtxR family transcriptional regulator [Pseudonocardiales bacterium]
MAPSSKDPGASVAVQDYAKTIYVLTEHDGGAVGTTLLAERLGVSASSASGMIRRLDELGLVEHVPYRGVRLSPAGRELALKMVRRHRLLELYLVKALDLPWDQVHAEAEVLEHALSDQLEDAIAKKLGQPELDPHGDPIPTRDGRVSDAATVRLDEAAPGTVGELVRVSDTDPAMLRYLAEHAISLGDRIEVIDRVAFGGTVAVRVGVAPDDVFEQLGESLAAAMRIRVGAASTDQPATVV